MTACVTFSTKNITKLIFYRNHFLTKSCNYPTWSLLLKKDKKFPHYKFYQESPFKQKTFFLCNIFTIFTVKRSAFIFLFYSDNFLIVFLTKKKSSFISYYFLRTPINGQPYICTVQSFNKYLIFWILIHMSCHFCVWNFLNVFVRYRQRRRRKLNKFPYNLFWQ